MVREGGREGGGGRGLGEEGWSRRGEGGREGPGGGGLEQMW